MNSSMFSPQHVHPDQRSTSRSPIRPSRTLAHELNPLLTDLSPSKILEAVSATHAHLLDSSRSDSALQASIAKAGPAERAFGARAAFAAKKAQEWLTEVKSWSWPGPQGNHALNGYQAPPVGERDWKRRRMTAEDVCEEEEYWGSLPAGLVTDHESRLDTIQRGIEELDVEALKEHVLGE